MSLVKRALRLSLAAIIVASGLTVVAPLSSASAAGLDVCASGCGYTTIQAAITAASSGDTISVAAGTYTEQLVIDKNLTLIGAGASTTIIQAPGSLVLDVYNRYTIVLFYGSVTTEFSGFTVAGPGANLNFGIAVRGGATANIYDNVIKDIRDSSSLGAQRVKALIVDGSSTATITNNTIIGYQKEAINVWASSATITGNTITGDGPITTIAQNGIVITTGSTATVTNNTVTGNAYDGPTWTAVGILAMSAGSGVIIQGNTVTGNSANIYAWNSNGIQIKDNQVSDSSPVDQTLVAGITVGVGLGIGTPPLTGVTISGNTVQNNLSGGVSRGDGIDLYGLDGATVSGNTINGAYNDGIWIGASGNIAFTNNHFSGNGLLSANTEAAAIDFGSDGSLNPLGGFTVHNNTFSGNRNAIWNYDPGVVDAINNWWGDASGPGVLPNVAVTPWCTDACLTNNADLRSLSLSSGTLSPAFSPAITSYTASVPNSVSSVTCNYYVESLGAVVASPIGLSYNLVEGDNVITFTVTSTDEMTVKTYTITVTRAAVEIPKTPVSSTQVSKKAIEFVSGATFLTKSMRKALRKSVAVAGASATFVITGSAGRLSGVSETYVRNLAKKRANVVKAYLIKLGVSKSAITVKIKIYRVGVTPKTKILSRYLIF